MFEEPGLGIIILKQIIGRPGQEIYFEELQVLSPEQDELGVRHVGDSVSLGESFEPRQCRISSGAEIVDDTRSSLAIGGGDRGDAVLGSANGSRLYIYQGSMEHGGVVPEPGPFMPTLLCPPERMWRRAPHAAVSFFSKAQTQTDSLSEGFPQRLGTS